MAQLAPAAPPPAPTPEKPVHANKAAAQQLRFECLLLDQESIAAGRSTTFGASLVVHCLLALAVVIIPLLTYNTLPVPGDAVRAFFVAPAEVAPPPPPPPPPPAGARRATRAPAAPRPVTESTFVAPIEVPDEIKPEEGLDLAGIEGGVPGGVEGGVPGGVVGGIVGGMPTEAPPPPKAVRVGGQVKEPKRLYSPPPTYPELAAQARLSAVVIMEALVDTGGRVKSVKVLRGAPLFDDAAIAAVKQWRYQPLLLNGIPTEFILTVTVKFNLTTPKS